MKYKIEKLSDASTLVTFGFTHAIVTSDTAECVCACVSEAIAKGVLVALKHYAQALKDAGERKKFYEDNPG